MDHEIAQLEGRIGYLDKNITFSTDGLLDYFNKEYTGLTDWINKMWHSFERWISILIFLGLGIVLIIVARTLLFCKLVVNLFVLFVKWLIEPIVGHKKNKIVRKPGGALRNYYV